MKEYKMYLEEKYPEKDNDKIIIQSQIENEMDEYIESKKKEKIKKELEEDEDKLNYWEHRHDEQDLVKEDYEENHE